MSVTTIINDAFKNREIVSTAGITSMEDIQQQIGEVSMESVNTDSVKAQLLYNKHVQELKTIKDELANKLENIQTLDTLYVNKLTEARDTITLLEDLEVKKQQTVIDTNRLNTLHNKTLTELKEQYEDKVSRLEDRVTVLKAQIEDMEDDFETQHKEELRTITYEHNKVLIELKDRLDRDTVVIDARFKVDTRDNDEKCAILQKEIDSLEDTYNEAKEYMEMYEDKLNEKVEKVKDINITQLNKELEADLKARKLESVTKLSIINTQIDNGNKSITDKQTTMEKLENDLKEARENFNALVQSAK